MALVMWLTGLCIGALAVICYDLCCLATEQKKYMYEEYEYGDEKLQSVYAHEQD